jgi:hypothetical protein
MTSKERIRELEIVVQQIQAQNAQLRQEMQTKLGQLEQGIGKLGFEYSQDAKAWVNKGLMDDFRKNAKL